MVECTSPRILLASNMKRLRRLHGYSQAVLAERVGCSVTMIGNVETLRKFPSPENLQRIAMSLDAPVCDLFIVWAPMSGNVPSRPETGARQTLAGRGECPDTPIGGGNGSPGAPPADLRVRRLIRTGS